MRSNFPIPDSADPIIAFGVHDSHLRLMERLLSLKIIPHESELIIEGEDENINIASNVLDNLFSLSKSKTPVSNDEIKLIIEESRKFHTYTLDNIAAKGLMVSKRKKRIKPRSVKQMSYIKKIFTNDIIFSTGPAGTGKTFLAVAVALHYLHTGNINRIILTRPVVEAGESLGFLPGTLEEKINPYTRPLYDAIQEMLSADELKALTEHNIIELAPLAYMRGRTLSNAFIILDEAQNTSHIQMKMFLTRLGEGSKMVITGDISQTDLPKGAYSGLREAIELFGNIRGIAIEEFDSSDVVRHDLVRKIVEIYDEREKQK
jgi:phosphate starvation-inducible PhoH-like protein